MLKGDAAKAPSAAGGVARTGASNEESNAAGSARSGSPAIEILK